MIIYSLIPPPIESFSDIASQRIVDAIDSPQGIEVLNNSVSGLGILQDFKSNQKGTLANYRVPNSNKTFNPGISDRGIEIAKEARPIFTKQEWKLFRKFLQKNFTKGI